ncbi:MAG: NAD+ synthase [Bacteroidetes bacterium]|nr:NAD+ synthase [Bacteroidota bacterium]
MKVALVQLNPHVANIDENTNKIISYIHQAKESNVDLVVFPELCVCGYPPMDFLLFADFVEQCKLATLRIASECIGISAIVGSPIVNENISGKDLFNAALYMENGEIKTIIRKTLLPNYDVFDEYRYFEPNSEFDIVTCKGVKIALTVCEDLWNLNSNPLYIKNPMDELKVFQPELMVNIAASPFSYKHPETRKNVLLSNVEKYQIPIVYVNQSGAQTELVFDGNSQVLNVDKTSFSMRSFNESMECFIYDQGTIIPENQDRKEYTQNADLGIYDLIERALIQGIRDYFKKSGFSKAILGLSGGVDSALVYVLAAKALGVENVLPVLMPSQYSSDHSISDSIKLLENLNCPKHHIVPIKEVFESIDETLNPYFEGKSPDLTEENIQSRIRGLFLMALSNKHGYILLNTSNKSELAVGYGTLYGDMAGGLSVIGDLYKTHVYKLCEWINRNEEIIPQNILTKEPSAELRPDQKDSDSLPAYDLLDAVLELYIEENQSAQKIIEKGFDEPVVKKILRLVNMNEYKRKQTPPILRVSPRAFGPGRRMPIVAKYN